MDTPWVPLSYWNNFPHTLTVITTYKCNAACRECCFECGPHLSARLSRGEIIDFVDLAVQNFAGLKLVVFSGGECFLLGEDLFAAIEHVRQKGLLCRCVTNGYWGKSIAGARRIAQQLIECGLNEINISTGVDHAEWVAVAHVLTAAKAMAEVGIFCVITVEQDTQHSEVALQVKADAEIASLVQQGLLKVQINSWMPFHTNSVERKELSNRDELLYRGCDQIFENVVITPNKEVSGCCGLTFEHIPEMKLACAGMDGLGDEYFAQTKDFLKVWLKVDGPVQIIKILSGDEDLERLSKIVHPCQACALLHQDPGLRQKAAAEYTRHMERVLRAFYSQALMQIER
jgi:pyruvate-formate lyase-activating enzyme